MNATTLKRSSAARTLEIQIRRAKAVLRELQETVEDLEDGLEIEKAKRRNGKKPLLDWEDVAKELGIPASKKNLIGGFLLCKPVGLVDVQGLARFKLI